MPSTLKSLVIIDKCHADDGQFLIETPFTVWEGGGEQDTDTPVGTSEADANSDLISNESPAGTAAVRHAFGDTVEVSVPGVTRL